MGPGGTHWHPVRVWLGGSDVSRGRDPIPHLRKGSAKLQKAFLNASSGLPVSVSLISSKQTKPVTIAVVVAMAGMILPAICFVR